jgi:hypothetical protein
MYFVSPKAVKTLARGGWGVSGLMQVIYFRLNDNVLGLGKYQSLSCYEPNEGMTSITVKVMGRPSWSTALTLSLRPVG